MRAIDHLDDLLEIEREATRAWRDQARRDRRWAQFCAVLAIACGMFGLMMLNALPSAHGAAPVARSVVDTRAERVLRAWCPSSMSRARCVRWMRVAQCETGDPADRGVTYRSLMRIRWRYNGSSGYDGALQFGVRTWRGNIGRVAARSLTRAQYVARARGRYAFAYSAPPAVQVLTAEALRTRRDGGGLGHWPRCGRRYSIGR